YSGDAGGHTWVGTGVQFGGLLLRAPRTRHLGGRRMSVYVFVGPTIGTDEASKELDATFLPPAAQGDVYRIASEGARAIGIIADATRRKLERIAKDLFYPNRRYEVVIKQAINEKLPGPELSRFADWLPSGAVDQKRIDALAMLRTMSRQIASDTKPNRVGYFFEHSWVWEQLVRESTAASSNSAIDENTTVSDPAGAR